MNAITVHSDHLAAALKHGVAAGRSPMSVLQHARLRVADGDLLVETTDCEVWVQSRIPVEAEGEFDLLLNDELLRPVAAPGAGTLTIRPDGRVTSERGRYAIPMLSADGFPTSEDTAWQPIEVDAKALHDAIRSAAYTGEDQSIQVLFRSVHVTPDLVWCTDGKQIAAIALDYNGPQLAIPVAQVRRVLDALQQEGATVWVGNMQAQGAGLLRVGAAGLQVSLRLAAPAGATTMADYVARVREGEVRVRVRRDELLQALRRFLPFVTFGLTGSSAARKAALPTARLVYDTNGLGLRDKTGEFSEQLAGAELTDAGGEWQVAFDVKRVIAALSVLDVETIELMPLATHGANKLLAITPQGCTLDRVAHLLALIQE